MRTVIQVYVKREGDRYLFDQPNLNDLPYDICCHGVELDVECNLCGAMLDDEEYERSKTNEV